MKFPVLVKARQKDFLLNSFLIHECKLTAYTLRYEPGNADPGPYVSRTEVRKVLKSAVGERFRSKIRIPSDGLGVLSYPMERPTFRTFRVGCCTFGPKATEILCKWAGVK